MAYCSKDVIYVEHEWGTEDTTFYYTANDWRGIGEGFADTGNQGGVRVVES